MPAPTQKPWLWAGIHGAFVLAASLSHLAAWRLNEQQGLRDPLTGLANRTQLVETADRLLAGAAPVSVMVLDVDDFKDVNDSRGHAAGDRLLVAVADRLRGCLRPEDAIARLGGDEFAVVIAAEPAKGAQAWRTDAQRARRPAARRRPAAGRPRQHRRRGQRHRGDRSALTLLRNADLAMYMAKAAGRTGSSGYADGMAQAARSKVELLEDLAVATSAGQLEVHYQPTVSLTDGDVPGSRRSCGGTTPRGDRAAGGVHPAGRGGGHIVEIGRWVLEQACGRPPPGRARRPAGRDRGQPLPAPAGRRRRRPRRRGGAGGRAGCPPPSSPWRSPRAYSSGTSTA